MTRSPTFAALLLVAVSCGPDKQTTPPEPTTTTPPAADDGGAAEGGEEPGLAGVGHCCKDGACVGKEYTSAHAFSEDCAAMEATEAKWCKAGCEVVEEPYACNCPG